MKKTHEPILLILISLLARGSNFLSAIVIYNLVSSEKFVEISWYLLLTSLTSLFAGLGFSNFLLKFIFNPSTFQKASFLIGIKKIVSMWISMFVGLNLFITFNSGFLPIEGLLAINLSLLEGIVGAISIEVLYNSLMAKAKVKQQITLNLLLIVINGPFRIVLFLIFNQSIMFWALTGVVSKILVVAHFSRKLWKEIDFAEHSSKESINYTVFSRYLLFPIFSIGQWLTANIDKYIGTDLLKSSDLANYQLTFQFAALIGMIISQIDLYFLPNLYKAYSKKNLQRFTQLQMQASTLAGIAMSTIATLSWYFLINDNSQKWIKILLLMSMAQLFYVPVAVYASLVSKIKHETNKLFFAPYISIGIIIPFIFLYTDMSQASNLARTYFLLSLATLIIVLMSDALFGEKILFRAFVTPRFLSVPIIILVYSISIFISSKNILILITVAILSLVFSLYRLLQIFEKVRDLD